MDRQNSKIFFAAIILAAGASSRMGRSKLLLPWNGTTVVGHLISQWQALGAEQIAVVHRPKDIALNLELDRLKFSPENRIENPQAEQGMFSSILCAANWAGWHRDISSWAIVLGDQPHLRFDTLQTLLEFHFRNPDAICQPELRGEPKHPVVLPRAAFEKLKKSRDETFKIFLQGISGSTIKYPVEDLGLSLDLDTPQDYQRALNRQFVETKI